MSHVLFELAASEGFQLVVDDRASERGDILGQPQRDELCAQACERQVIAVRGSLPLDNAFYAVSHEIAEARNDFTGHHQGVWREQCSILSRWCRRLSKRVAEPAPIEMTLQHEHESHAAEESPAPDDAKGRFYTLPLTKTQRYDPFEDVDGATAWHGQTPSWPCRIVRIVTSPLNAEVFIDSLGVVEPNVDVPLVTGPVRVDALFRFRTPPPVAPESVLLLRLSGSVVGVALLLERAE